MEVYSAQKHVKPVVTLGATLVLFAIALLQAFSMVAQEVSLNGDLTVAIPADWSPVDVGSPDRWCFASSGGTESQKVLCAQRIVGWTITDVERALAPHYGAILLPQGEPCLFGDHPAYLASFQVASGIRTSYLTVVFATEPKKGSAILTLEHQTGDSAYLLRRIAQYSSF